MNKGYFQPSGIITLTTDFGLRDPYVGTMKGVILRGNPNARIVDLCHFISPQSIWEASFFLDGSCSYFPPGTLHVVVVDPGVGTQRPILIVRKGNHLFLAPDNGVLTNVLEAADGVWKLKAEEFALPSMGRTFHGRDVFAPAAGKLSESLAPETAGVPVQDWVRKPLPKPRAEKKEVFGEVLIVDRFGNLVTNLTEPDLLPLASTPKKSLTILIKNTTIRGISETYREGKPGDPLALIGSYGHLEIAVPMGNAAEQLGINPGIEVKIY